MGRLVGGRSAKGFRMPWITGVFLEIIHISAPDIRGNVLRDDSVAAETQILAQGAPISVEAFQ